jgi:hypothetical protein
MMTLMMMINDGDFNYVWGLALPGQKGNHDSWVKCATSAEGSETDISAVLTVKSSLGILFD